MARDVVGTLPEPFRSMAASVALEVEEMPPEDVLEELGIEDPLSLTGLYEGIPLTEKSVFDQPLAPDVIRLFRRPILAELATRPGVSLEALVRNVVVHELAHHFGWSDDDIAAVDQWWE
ncbi:MAG: metallopeptidase family protein [Alphaproteobacteria bacterium]|nr:MAG: metallopeptidase family protein [Alphaproteobacteria bacterium]